MGHSHGHSYEHSHKNPGGRNILFTIILNVLITLAQIAGGIISGSMALLSDAAHNLSDVLSLVISYLASRISVRAQTIRQTYGFKRAEIFAAFINTAILLVIGVILIWEAVARILNPQPISGNIVIYLAAAGAVLNGLSLIFIRKEAQTNMNFRSAYLHLFMDMLTSLAVLLGGVIIRIFGFYLIDSILTILISLYLIYSSWGIFYNAIRIFMQFTPSHIDIEEIAVQITSLSGIKNIHHVHVWQLDENEMMLEAHVDLEEDIKISRFEEILAEVETVLRRFDIHHFNIQPEILREDQKDLINISPR
jgi:cobalt-zinc-cadmium efflux system protein